MNHDQVRKVAQDANLGTVHFQFNIARNSGERFEVGYVVVAGRQELFCKRQPGSSEDAFYLCNEFGSLCNSSPA